MDFDKPTEDSPQRQIFENYTSCSSQPHKQICEDYKLTKEAPHSEICTEEEGKLSSPKNEEGEFHVKRSVAVTHLGTWSTDLEPEYSSCVRACLCIIDPVRAASAGPGNIIRAWLAILFPKPIQRSCRNLVGAASAGVLGDIIRAWLAITKPIQRSCSYVFYYKRYVERLEYRIKRLCDIKAIMRLEVNVAISQKKIISPEVESWIREMDNIEAETQRFISEANKRKHLYWPIARYKLSHKCVEKLQLLLEREEEVIMFHDIADPSPPPRIGSTFVRILNPKFSRPT